MLLSLISCIQRKNCRDIHLIQILCRVRAFKYEMERTDKWGVTLGTIFRLHSNVIPDGIIPVQL